MKETTLLKKRTRERNLWRNYAGMRLSLQTRDLLNLIAAHTGETIIQAAERLAKQEWERVKDLDTGVEA